MTSNLFAGNKESGKIPIIYSRYYNITLFGIEKLHPFDSEKYGKIYRYLVKRTGVARNSFYKPAIVSDEDLLSVHTPAYLTSLRQPKNIAKIAELGILARLPYFILYHRLLKPMKYATGGTILGCELALKHGWAINLSGGYHHAKTDSGGGFCFFADIPIAVNKLFEKNDELSIMIIDLDAHQGNGIESFFEEDPRVHIFDVYNEDIYPQDSKAQEYIKFRFSVKSHISDKEYLELLDSEIGKAVATVTPDLIIYNAGTDIYEGDKLGCMNISEEGIIRRDEMVFKSALSRKIPILMVLSGGYTQKSANITARSIENILKNAVPLLKTEIASVESGYQ